MPWDRPRLFRACSSRSDGWPPVSTCPLPSRSEATHISPMSVGFGNTPGIWSEEQASEKATPLQPLARDARPRLSIHSQTCPSDVVGNGGARFGAQ